MIIPNAETIEGAVDELKKLDANIIVDQRKELHEAIGDHADDVQYVAGYTLGLQVARRMIHTSVAVLLNKVNPEDVL